MHFSLLSFLPETSCSICQNFLCSFGNIHILLHKVQALNQPVYFQNNIRIFINWVLPGWGWRILYRLSALHTPLPCKNLMSRSQQVLWRLFFLGLKHCDSAADNLLCHDSSDSSDWQLPRYVRGLCLKVISFWKMPNIWKEIEWHQSENNHAIKLLIHENYDPLHWGMISIQ